LTDFPHVEEKAIHLTWDRVASRDLSWAGMRRVADQFGDDRSQEAQDYLNVQKHRTGFSIRVWVFEAVWCYVAALMADFPSNRGA
jgi:hypothetical protein